MRVLDLYCGVGGASMGYSFAGYDVVGVDKTYRKNYPFGFHQGDAIDVLKGLILGESLEFTFPDGHTEWYKLSDFVAIHTSPPCQGFVLQAAKTRYWEDLVTPTRMLLAMTQIPAVIENVSRSPVRRDIILCGEMFSLSVIRHRSFELIGWTGAEPPHLQHRGRVTGVSHGVMVEGPYFAVYGEGSDKGSIEQWQTAMGIDWTDQRHELAEAIPPAYTKYIGGELLRGLVI